MSSASGTGNFLVSGLLMWSVLHGSAAAEPGRLDFQFCNSVVELANGDYLRFMDTKMFKTHICTIGGVWTRTRGYNGGLQCNWAATALMDEFDRRYGKGAKADQVLGPCS
jgi:hypothetical protein